MTFVSEDGTRFGFASGERAELRFRLERVPGAAYTIGAEDRLTLIIRDGTGKHARTIAEVSGGKGAARIVIPREESQKIKPGAYCGAVVLESGDEEIGRTVVWPKFGEKEIMRLDGYLPRENVLVTRAW